MTNLPVDQINGARGFIDQAQDILVALGSNPTVDSTAAALSIYLALSAQGKRVSIVCPDATTVEFSHLIGVDKISNAISGGTSGKNLVISFPYEEGSIEKVSYNIEGAAFNLVIEPRENYPVITPEMIRYTYSGGNTDAVIVINASRLEDLSALYQNNQGLFAEKPIVNIDVNSQNSRFGKSNIIDPSVSSVSELMTNVLSALGYSLDPDIATNLLLGISIGSQNFTAANTSAATFEAAAICLKSGARKQESTSPIRDYQFPRPSPQPFSKQPKTMMGTPPAFPRTQSQSAYSMPTMSKPQPQQQPLRRPYTPPTQTNQQQQPKSQTHQQTQPQQSENHSQQSQQKSDAPPDWLKPKIYKGSTLL